MLHGTVMQSCLTLNAAVHNDLQMFPIVYRFNRQKRKLSEETPKSACSHQSLSSVKPSFETQETHCLSIKRENKPRPSSLTSTQTLPTYSAQRRQRQIPVTLSFFFPVCSCKRWINCKRPSDLPTYLGLWGASTGMLSRSWIVTALTNTS